MSRHRPLHDPNTRQASVYTVDTQAADGAVAAAAALELGPELEQEQGLEQEE